MAKNAAWATVMKAGQVLLEQQNVERVLSFTKETDKDPGDRVLGSIVQGRNFLCQIPERVNCNVGPTPEFLSLCLCLALPIAFRLGFFLLKEQC